MIEAVLQRLILARVNQLDGVRVWRMNTGFAQRAGGGAVRFGLPGQADITGLMRPGRRVELEIKGPHGRVTPEQEAFGEWIRALGGLYLVCRSLEDAMGPIQEALR